MEKLSVKSFSALTLLFTLCNCFSLLFGTDAGRFLWLSYLIASAISLLLWALLARAMERGNFSSLFQMIDASLGKVLGRAVTFALLIYALLSSTTALSLFGRFTQLTALSKTPTIILPLLILLLCAIALKGGVSTMARSTPFLAAFALFTFVIFLLFTAPQMEFRNLLPIVGNSALPVIKNAFTVFTNQFGDLFLLFSIYPLVVKDGRKLSLWAVAIGSFICTVIAFITLAVLGSDQVATHFFPVYTLLSVSSVGEYIQHVEILTSLAMTFFVFARVGVSLYFAARALSHIFSTEHKGYLVPLALITACGTELLYLNMMSLRHGIEGELNLFLLLPLQLVLPLILAYKKEK